MSDAIRGLSFPFRITEGGGVAEQRGTDKLKENIVQILLTGAGERVMRRDYGGGLRKLLHDPSNVALKAIVQHQIAKAVSRFEPRVLVQSIEVEARRDGGAEQLWVSVSYVIRRTRQTQSLSVPIGLGGI